MENQTTSTNYRFFLDYNGNWKWIDVTLPGDREINDQSAKAIIDLLNAQTERGFIGLRCDDGLVIIDMRHVVAVVAVDMIESGGVTVEPVERDESDAD